MFDVVSIHNKNGKGLLLELAYTATKVSSKSQSTIKMEKGYYNKTILVVSNLVLVSQSTIKMEKGYYQ